MDPQEFLDLAEALCQGSPGEAACRTSVSRSYYALYNWVVIFLDDNGMPLSPDATSHKKAYQALLWTGIPEIKEVATAMDDLRTDRNKADYFLDDARFQKPIHALALYMKAKDAYDQFSSYIRKKNKKNHLVKRIDAYRKSHPSN